MTNVAAVGYRSPVNTQAASRTTPPTPKPDLAAIERNYQVPEQNVQDWSPKAFGFISTGSLFGTQKFTSTEGKMLDKLTRDQGIVGLKSFERISKDALSNARTVYPSNGTLPNHIKTNIEAKVAKFPIEQQGSQRAALSNAAMREWSGQDGHMDAFRHALWNAKLTSEFGSNWTKQFTTAHEGSSSGSSVREAMDLYNNEVGRKIATNNPNASAKELESLVKKAVDDGELVVIGRNGHLAWSNTVAVNDHGLSVSLSGRPMIATPNGDAYAQ